MFSVTRPTSIAAWLGAVAVLALLGAAPASAATYNVNTTTDLAAPGCVGGSCSLRQAVEAVNSGAGTGDTINVSAGRYVLTLGDLRLTRPATIVGAGARTTIVDGNSAVAPLYFETGSSPSSFSGLTVTGGSAGGPGGVYNQVNLTITNSTIAGNTAVGSTGGGIVNTTTGTLTITGSTVSGNTAGTAGGGIYNQGSLTVTNTTISGNSAAGDDGGGVYTDNAASISSSTIGGNSATGNGGGIDTAVTATVSLENTLIASNTVAGASANCAGPGTFTSLGNNLEDANTCNFGLASDLRNTAPGIGTLADNGGSTDTRALQAGSAAIGAGSGCPATDQRGVARPQGGACDIGAYEYAPPVVTTGSASARTTAGATISGTVLPNLRAASYHFEYGKTTAYGTTTTSASAGAGNTAAAVTATLTGLKSGTSYQYRLVASNADGTTNGSDRTFTTSRFSGASLLSRVLRVSRGRVNLRVNCPATTAGGACRDVVGLYKRSGRLPTSLSARRKARRLALGRFSAKAGKTQTKRIKLNRRGRKLLKGRRSARVRLVLTSRDNAGNATTKTYKVKLKRR